MRLGFTHESSVNETKEWYTPKYIFDALGLKFDMDVSSPGKEVVPWIPAERHITIKENGLLVPWEGSVWLNPPYGEETPRWLRKFIKHGHGVALVFARTDTAWFHNLAIRADALCFVSGPKTGFPWEANCIDQSRVPGREAEGAVGGF